MGEVSAFVLAGGRSSRMGVDKARLELGGRTFLDISLENARAVCPRPFIVATRAKFPEYPDEVEDRFPGCGPIGGVHAVLSVTETELNLILSVDMPLMDARFLQWLVEKARASQELVTAPRVEGRQQSLCAVYRRASLESVSAAIEAGRYKLENAIHGARIVAEDEILAAGFPLSIFRNINQPWEYEELRQSRPDGARAQGPKA